MPVEGSYFLIAYADEAWSLGDAKLNKPATITHMQAGAKLQAEYVATV